MELDVWIEFSGNEMDNFKSEGDWARDIIDNEFPKSRSPFFPSGHTAYWAVVNLAHSGKYETAMEDPLTGYVKVPKEEIVTVIKKLYGKIDDKNKMLDELLALVQTLSADKLYSLYYQEF